MLGSKKAKNLVVKKRTFNLFRNDFTRAMRNILVFEPANKHKVKAMLQGKLEGKSLPMFYDPERELSSGMGRTFATYFFPGVASTFGVGTLGIMLIKTMPESPVTLVVVLGGLLGMTWGATGSVVTIAKGIWGQNMGGNGRTLKRFEKQIRRKREQDENARKKLLTLKPQS